MRRARLDAADQHRPAIVLRLQTIVSREIAPREAAVVTIGALQAGTKENVIPDEAIIKLNVRTFDEGVRARVAAMIRVDAVWLAVAAIDMRAGIDTALARVVAVFGCAQAHHAYVFSNRRGNRIKVLVHDGLGIWLCARRLHQGRFVWPKDQSSLQMTLTRAQFDALVIGLPWARIGTQSAIALV